MMNEQCGSMNPMSEMICVREPDHYGDHGDALGRYWSVYTNVVARSEYENVVTERDTLAAEVRRLGPSEEAASVLAKMLEEVREVLGVPVDTGHAEVLELIAFLRSGRA